ncbi:helix-turn-helix domain-containing protein [Rhodococcus sp. ACS1]|uniref:helix-turn-helix domain-containing protein n=1 Tax=Rhodococcus sp. ACS1 TaxID=2028570 RepID=UPI0015CE3489|nr:helix-turn-helix transcriptional regulator [Rhodococcus sp. ACS1]
MVENGSRLGEYLRARRALVSPDAAGITDSGRRRVPGLRREELAQLAGISVVYYVRLEQGRDRHPSPDVLRGLAHALQLDDEAAQYLLKLGRSDEPSHRIRLRELVAPGIEQVVRRISAPAYVLGRMRDVLCSNPSAEALSPMFHRGSNQLRRLFLDPDARELLVDWNILTEDAVASLRIATNNDLEDPAVGEFIADLATHSSRFRQLWDRHDAGLRPSDVVRFRHSQIGEVSLHYNKLAVVGADRQTIVVFHAVPGSDAEQDLCRLATRG